MQLKTVTNKQSFCQYFRDFVKIGISPCWHDVKMLQTAICFFSFWKLCNRSHFYITVMTLATWLLNVNAFGFHTFSFS